MGQRYRTDMKKNVLIISSSARKGGNSDTLCDAYAEGARSAGHDVEKVRLAKLHIDPAWVATRARSPGCALRRTTWRGCCRS